MSRLQEFGQRTLVGSLFPGRRLELAVFPVELVQEQLGYSVERGKDIHASARDGFKTLRASSSVVQQILQIVRRSDLLKVSLVKLQNVRNLIRQKTLLLEIFLQITKAHDVLFHLIPMRISHENNSVDVAQYELPRRIVDDLPRHGIQLEFRFEPLEHYGVQR